MKLLHFLLLLFAALGPVVTKERSRISLRSDGGYTDLVFAIDRSRPEDPQLLEKFKRAISEFSKQLSVATKPMFNNGASLHIAQAYILVPKTWTNNLTQIDSQSTWQTFDNSDIRLGRSPQQPHYTYHSWSCGYPGDYTVFDSNYTLSTDTFWLGKQMLSEFGQLRWGLRSEHNGEEGPHAYFEGGNLVPAICIKSINGTFRHNVTQQPCKVDDISSKLDPHCRFYPYAEQEVEASLLSDTTIPTVEQFCDHWDMALPELRHNKRAPVPLNSVCSSSTGARDLMRKSQSGDFNTPPKQIAIPPVQFTVVRPLPYRRLVLIIDISGSMDGDPLNKIKVGVDKFIRDLAEDGIECAVVTFNESTQVVKPLNFFNSKEIREDYANAVRVLVARGFTAIGDGLALGMRVLGVDPANPSRDVPGYVLLLTDGGENRNQNYTLLEAAAVLRKTSLIVDTVTFGPKADKRLSELSEDTKGYSFFCRFENSTNDFIEQLSDTVRKRVESALMPIEVFSAPIETTFSVPIYIDKSVGKDTSFMLTAYRASDINSADLKVLSPSDKVYDRNSPQYSKDPELGTVAIKISGQAEIGEWRATDGRSATWQPSWSSAQVFNTRMALMVTSKPASSEEEPVVLDGSVSADVRVQLNRSTSITVVASMFKGFERIKGATILAKIESESSTDAVLSLQDDGVFPDLEAQDGIYSAQVPLKSVSKKQEYNVRLISDSPVSRVTSAGKFYVESVDLGSLQNLPPNPVKDLKVDVHLLSKTLHLWWTAVGNEHNQGTAARYTIKSSDNDTLIEEDFDSADSVLVTVTPLVVGSIQSVNISSDQLASYNSTFYLAVQAVSNNGVKSKLSNLVATQLKLPDNIDSIDGSITSPMPSTTVAPEIFTTKSGDRAGLQGNNITSLLLGLCMAAVAALW